jgi:predicted O-methyltransferase YrrM
MILDPVVADYLAGLYPASDPVLQEMERQGEAEGVPIVMKDGGLTLGVLARAVGARRVVECGTAIGVSTLHLARAVGDGGEVITFDVDPDRQATARGYLERAGVADRVDLRLQPALDGLRGVEGPFDLAFVDAIKAEYAGYVELIVPMLRVGGMLVIDNSLMSGSVAAGRRTSGGWTQGDIDALRSLNAALVAREDLATVVLPVADGMTVAVKTSA